MIEPSALILVTILKEPRDLEIARVLGWYRIPLRSAPKVVGVDYLAFYQTSNFGAEKWQIKYLAPVRGYELTTRAELFKDELDNPYAKHEYYKIQIGALIEIASPILAAKWKRITFFYTTGEYLLQANTVNDLIVESDERRLLWRALYERASAQEAYTLRDFQEQNIDPMIIDVLLGLNLTNKNR